LTDDHQPITKKMNEEKRILGIDYGRKRIGLSISDPLGIIATPVDTVNRKKVIERIQEILVEFKLKKIIIGYPLRSDGEKGRSTEEVEKFAQLIEKTFGIEIELWDERYSTIEAERIMRDAGKSSSREKRKVDMIAAAVILQSYLDERGGEDKV